MTTLSEIDNFLSSYDSTGDVIVNYTVTNKQLSRLGIIIDTLVDKDLADKELAELIRGLNEEWLRLFD